MPSITVFWDLAPDNDNVTAVDVHGANGTSVAFGSCPLLASVSGQTDRWTDPDVAADQARTYWIVFRNAIGSSSPEGPINITAAAASSTYVQRAGDTMTGLLTLSGDPGAALQAATKQYVDNAIAGLSWKQACAVATTANITLSGEQTIDGVTTSASRVLVKNQSTASQNGIYVSASGSWARSSDMSIGAEFPGASVFIEAGTAGADTQWVCTNTSPPTVGTAAITFAQFSSGGGGTPGGSSGQLQYNNAGAFGGGDLSGDVTTSGSLVTTIAANAVTNAKFRQSGALAVVGRSANSTGNVSDIQATAASNKLLREKSSALQFDTLSNLLDDVFSSTEGAVLYRGASGWAGLGPGTAGYVLATGGPSAVPVWTAPASIIVEGSSGFSLGPFSGFNAPNGGPTTIITGFWMEAGETITGIAFLPRSSTTMNFGAAIYTALASGTLLASSAIASYSVTANTLVQIPFSSPYTALSSGFVYGALYQSAGLSMAVLGGAGSQFSNGSLSSFPSTGGVSNGQASQTSLPYH